MTITAEIRIVTKGGDATVQTFRLVGKEGEKELKRLQRVGVPVAKNLRGIDDAAKAAQTGLRGVGQAAAVITGPLSGISSRIVGLSALLRTIGPLGLVAALGITGLAFAVGKSLFEFAEFEKQQLRVQATLEATGFAAGAAAGDLERFAIRLGRDTLTSAGAVREATAALLTFKTITGDIFFDVLLQGQNISALFGGELRENVVQLAKAFEDPGRGLTQLRRKGILFGLSLEREIKDLFAAGKLVEGQLKILGRIQEQADKVAAGEAGGLTGDLDNLGEALTNFFVNLADSSGAATVAGGILNALAGGVDAVAEAFEGVKGLSDDDLQKIIKLAEIEGPTPGERVAAGALFGLFGAVVVAPPPPDAEEARAEIAFRLAKRRTATAKGQTAEINRQRELLSEQHRVAVGLLETATAARNIAHLTANEKARIVLEERARSEFLKKIKLTEEQLNETQKSQLEGFVKLKQQAFDIAKAADERRKAEEKITRELERQADKSKRLRDRQIETFKKTEASLKTQIAVGEALLAGDKERAETIKLTARFEGQISQTILDELGGLDALILRLVEVNRLVRQRTEKEREAERLLKRQAELALEPFKNAIREMQRVGSDFWFDFYRTGEIRAASFFGAMRDSFARLLAELTTIALFNPIIISVVQGGLGAFGFGGAASQAAALGGSGGVGAVGAVGLGSLGLSAAGVTGAINAFGGGLGFATAGTTATLPATGAAITLPSTAGFLGTSATLSQVLGAGALGALGGNLLTGLLGLPGKTGGTIGGGIGGAAGFALGGPLGAIVGTALGGIIGGLFGKTPKSGATLSVGADSFIDIENLFKRGRGDKKVAQQLAQSVAAQLQQIADQFDIDLLPGFSIGQIGKRKSAFVFSETVGPNKQFGGPKDDDRKFSSADDAVQAAILSALRRGVLQGLSEASQEVLASATNLDEALRQIAEIEGIEASALEAIQNLSLAILQFTDPLEAAKQSLIQAQQEQVDLLLSAGRDLAEGTSLRDDLNQLFGLQREGIIEAFTAQGRSALEGLLASLTTGPLAGLTVAEQERLARTEFEDLFSTLQAGGGVDPQELALAVQALLALSGDIHGISPTFAGDREAAIAATNLALQQLEAGGEGFLNADIVSELVALSAETAEGNANNEALLGEVVDELRELVGLVKGSGGGGSLRGSGGLSGGGLNLF